MSLQLLQTSCASITLTTPKTGQSVMHRKVESCWNPDAMHRGTCALPNLKRKISANGSIGHICAP